MANGNDSTGADSGLSAAAGSEAWRDFDWGECGECGSHDLETLTSVEAPYHADGDTIRCKECGELGGIMCDSEMPATCFWNGQDGLEVSLPNVERRHRAND